MIQSAPINEPAPLKQSAPMNPSTTINRQPPTRQIDPSPPPTDHRDRDERTLLFLHVPKTAGTTLNRIIEAQYSPLRIYTIPGGNRIWSIEHFKQLSEARRANLRVLKGHMGFGLHRLIPAPTTYFTMLREPVDQVASSYYYALSHRGHPLHRVVVNKKISLQQFIELAPWGNNLQTKLISGMAMAEINPPQALQAARQGIFLRDDEFPGRDCDEQALTEAKKNLRESFSVVGLTERFEESLAWMMIEYGWRVPYYQRFRKSAKRPKRDRFDSQVRRRIEASNSFDLELYDFGRQLFEQAIRTRREEVERIRQRWTESPQPGRLRAKLHAGVAWGRGLTSIIRSAC